jgi:hypothetical protein
MEVVMISKIKSIFLGPLIILAASGITAAPAFAEGPAWQIKGKELKAGETAKISGFGTLSFVVPELEVTVVCEELTDNTTLFGGIPGTDKDHLQYSKCMVVGKLPTCKAEEPIDIKSNTKLVFLIKKAAEEFWKEATKNEWEKAPEKGEQRAYGDEYSPEMGETLFVVNVVKVGGEICTAAKEYKATGAFGGIVNGNLFEFSDASGALKINGKPAYVTGLIENDVVNEKGEFTGETFGVSETSATHTWSKNGASLTQTESVVSEGGLFQLVAGTKIIDCETVHDVGTVGAADKGEATEIHFLNCKTNQTGCDVHSGGAPNGLVLATGIPTLLVERENTANEKVIADEFKSKTVGSTKEIVTLLFLALSGGSCSEYGTSTKVKGQVAAVVNNATDSLEFTNPELKDNTLEAFGVAAKLFGTDKQTLTNGGTLTAN